MKVVTSVEIKIVNTILTNNKQLPRFMPRQSFVPTEDIVLGLACAIAKKEMSDIEYDNMIVLNNYLIGKLGRVIQTADIIPNYVKEPK